MHGAESIPDEPSHARDPALIAERDRAALTAALDPIITIDARGIILSASDSVRRVLGWTPTELIGRNVSILMPEPHHGAHDRYLHNYLSTGQTNIMNRPRRFDAVRKDGTLVPIELCVSRAELPGGKAPLLVGIIRDMTIYATAERTYDQERVRSQQLLAQQTSALQSAHMRLRMADRMASIGTLAAGLGHDMNNVLLPVRARLNALRAAGRSGKIPLAEQSHIDEIRKSVAYLQQLADGLHFLAMDPHTDEDVRGGGAVTDLAEWWKQSGPLLSKAVPKHVRVTASLPADLPAIALAAHGLTQAILNLIVNAGESIPDPSQRKRRQGHVRLWAKARQDPRGRSVIVGVTDNGGGMPPEVRRRACEMFFTTKPRGLGTGLGLALVRKVIDRCHGTIEIESEVGKGTTVSLIVPAAGPAQPSSSAIERPMAVVSVADGRAAHVIRAILEDSSFRVRFVAEPGQARIWVLDPAAAHPTRAQAWQDGHPDARLVLVGRPDSTAEAQWRTLGPIIIEQPEDFESLRAALARAVAPV